MINFHHLPNTWLMAIFGTIVITLLVADLFFLHKKGTSPSFRRSLKICSIYVLVAVLFGFFVIFERDLATGLTFFTGYLVEFSLSIDNIFVISLVFSSLKIPPQFQHRVLFWGVLGAVVMRAVMILLGASLVSNFHWVLYIFSVFLIYTGIKMLTITEHETPLTERPWFQFLQSHLRVTNKNHEERFFVKENRKLYITPLFFALIIVEMMDVIFAVDSIPAIFLITDNLFVIYTSNIFAILGLRSLYFLLAAAVNRFTYLKTALAVILIFIGCKIFMPCFGFYIEAWQSLVVTFSLLCGGVVFSLVKTAKLKRQH